MSHSRSKIKNQNVGLPRIKGKFGYGVLILCLLGFAFFPAQGIALEAKAKALNHDLFSVCFPTDEKGCACGRWGTLLHSSEMGNMGSSIQEGKSMTLAS